MPINNDFLDRVSAGCFPASFYTQSTSPQRSSSTSGYNGSLSGSVSPSNPYSQAFQSGQSALGGLYGGNSFHHPATSPLATTNNGSTQDWAYAAQAAYTAQAAFGTAHASNYNQTAAVAAGAQSAGLHGQYNPAHAALTSALPTSSSGGYPFSSQQDQHRQAAFATGTVFIPDALSQSEAELPEAEFCTDVACRSASVTSINKMIN